MNITQIKETCLYSRNLDQMRRFYHELLGFPIINELQDKHIFFRVGSSVLLCFNPDDSSKKKTPPAHFAEGKYHLAFEVSQDEYDEHKREIISKGIAILDTVKWKSGLESFYFEDLEGNVLEIVPAGIW